jgi:hypothetical protein
MKVVCKWEPVQGIPVLLNSAYKLEEQSAPLVG